MVNIWKYADSEKVRVIDTDGKEYEGKVAELVDSDVEDDIDEDEIVIYDNGKYTSFKQSEIKQIKEL